MSVHARSAAVTWTTPTTTHHHTAIITTDLPQIHLDGRVELLKARLEQELQCHRVREVDRVGLALVPAKFTKFEKFAMTMLRLTQEYNTIK